MVYQLTSLMLVLGWLVGINGVRLNRNMFVKINPLKLKDVGLFKKYIPKDLSLLSRIPRACGWKRSQEH